MKKDLSFDVVVIGGGHAGCEAAAGSARLGVNTALYTHKIETIGEMSCNPAIGGLGKGHLVREIDALDGVMGDVADKSGIQFRLLNRSRGPAVQGPRTQSDRALYRKYMQQKLQNYCNLAVFSDPVIKFIFNKNNIIGFETKSGKNVFCKKLILTTGTFLNGLIHVGEKQTPAGRYNEKPSTGLSEQLKKYNFKIGRLKTGTPPRLDSRTINFTNLEEQRKKSLEIKNGINCLFYSLFNGGGTNPDASLAGVFSSIFGENGIPGPRDITSSPYEANGSFSGVKTRLTGAGNGYSLIVGRDPTSLIRVLTADRTSTLPGSSTQYMSGKDFFVDSMLTAPDGERLNTERFINYATDLEAFIGDDTSGITGYALMLQGGKLASTGDPLSDGEFFYWIVYYLKLWFHTASLCYMVAKMFIC